MGHCDDCCCARSWEALGVTEYTGLSIPEHIARLRRELDEAREIAYQRLVLVQAAERERDALADRVEELEGGIKRYISEQYHLSVVAASKVTQPERVHVSNLARAALSPAPAEPEEQP